MKTEKVPPQARTVRALLRRAHHGGLILRSPEGREYVLAEIDDFNREIELTRRNKRLMRLLDERAKQTGVVGLAEAASRLGL